MLDMEYMFTELPRDDSAAKRLAVGEAAAAPPTLLKRRLYALLDGIPVTVPWNATNWMPVSYGGGVEQFLWMANHQLLYDGPGADRDVRIRFRLRDSDGAVVHNERRMLESGTSFRLNLSSNFPQSAGLSIGSIAIDRYATGPMVRGTTRPQIEITCAKSAARLHFQAPAPDQTKSLRTRWRPEVERCLFSIINFGRRPYRVEFAYQTDDSLKPERLGEAECTVPPYGAAMHAVELPSHALGALGNGLLLLKWQTHDEGKPHFICMTRDGERLSIDHQ